MSPRWPTTKNNNNNNPNDNNNNNNAGPSRQNDYREHHQSFMVFVTEIGRAHV